MPRWMWTVCQHGSVDLRKEEEEAIGTFGGRCSSSPCKEKPFAHGAYTLEFREEQFARRACVLSAAAKAGEEEAEPEIQDSPV